VTTGNDANGYVFFDIVLWKSFAFGAEVVCLSRWIRGESLA
jgi:hypothetical protein